jgi:thioredoxin 1
MAGAVIHATKENWDDEVMKSPIPVLVDFWAEYCKPCRDLAPVLEELAAELAGRLKIVKVDAQECNDLAGTYRIRALPTLLVIKGGAVQSQMVGGMRKADLLAKLAPYV